MVTMAATGIVAGLFAGILTINSPAVQAQVAAPSLLPGSARVVDPNGWIGPINSYGENFTTTTDGTITPDNPAAMQWAHTSEIAFGQFESENSHKDDPSLTDYTYDYSGNFYGARWVNEYFSIGGEVIEWEADSTPDGDFDTKHQNWSLSVNLFDVASLGTSKTVQIQEFLFFGMFNLVITRETQSTGATIRLAENFYLGLVQGTEKIRLENQTVSFDVQNERDVRQIAIALSTQGETKWHLEYQQGSKDGVLVSASDYIAGEEETVIVLEVLYKQLAAGITFRSVTTSRPVNTSTFPNTFDGETDVTRLSIGWVTSFGFALNAAFESTEINGAISTASFTRTIDTTVLSASYQF